ncbi:hypothetical protein A2U01_0119355, partial [Trifolium medium]|nr:hypothetical protein [Trifolium medium]
ASDAVVMRLRCGRTRELRSHLNCGAVAEATASAILRPQLRLRTAI